MWLLGLLVMGLGLTTSGLSQSSLKAESRQKALTGRGERAAVGMPVSPQFGKDYSQGGKSPYQTAERKSPGAP